MKVALTIADVPGHTEIAAPHPRPRSSMERSRIHRSPALTATIQECVATLG